MARPRRKGDKDASLVPGPDRVLYPIWNPQSQQVLQSALIRARVKKVGSRCKEGIAEDKSMLFVLSKPWPRLYTSTKNADRQFQRQRIPRAGSGVISESPWKDTHLTGEDIRAKGLSPREKLVHYNFQFESSCLDCAVWGMKGVIWTNHRASARCHVSMSSREYSPHLDHPRHSPSSIRNPRYDLLYNTP